MVPGSAATVIELERKKNQQKVSWTSQELNPVIQPTISCPPPSTITDLTLLAK